MEGKTILILGGYGNTGRALARLLLQESNARLLLAGRNIARANEFAHELNFVFEGDRVQGIFADASEVGSLSTAFRDAAIVVVASSTTQYTRQIATAALAVGAGYLDVQVSTRKVALLRSMAESIRQARCCFITDGGFHPGLPAFLVRYAAQSFDRLEQARVGSVIKQDWKQLKVDDSTVYELVELMNEFEMLVFKAGKWKKASLLSTVDFIRMDFGGEFGEQFCAPMLLEEMRQLPAMYPSLTDTGFYVGGFNWFVDWVIMPVALIATRLWPRAAVKPMGKWMHWGLNTFSRPPYATLLKVEATGEKGGRPKKVSVTISHPDGYLFTAIPVAACLLQYLDGSIDKPGVWLQAHAVEPERFLGDMKRMGINVREEQAT